MKLVEKYRSLLTKYHFEGTSNDSAVNDVVREALERFTAQCSNPAIWCYGEHTRMLTRDFIFEMRRVKYIIDQKYETLGECGYYVIGKSQIKECKIDGIIISSYYYKEEIKNLIKQECPDIPYLDIYEELEKQGIVLEDGYYNHNGLPELKYIAINQLQRECSADPDSEEIYLKIINEYVNIMDFQSAIVYAEKLEKLKDSSEYHELRRDLEEIYQQELDAVSRIASDNVVMFCIDGLRRKDVLDGNMPKLKQYLAEHTRLYTNAYSVSTSTYESLMPTYSENSDMRTIDYERDSIDEQDCRFVTEALKQHRHIYFYTCGTRYIESKKIQVQYIHQSAAEKMWNFIVDAEEEKNGLFYIHVLHESHFSFPNPDTKEELVYDGTGILQDYFERKGGKIRADYVRQHTDAIKYLDRILSPFIERLPCRMVFFADHGNLLVPYGTPLEAFEGKNLCCAEDMIEIPLAIQSPEMEDEENISNNLMSLMSLNEMVCSLLKKEKFKEPQNQFIKVQRSVAYNPEGRYLFEKMGRKQDLEAFEAFIFKNGQKLIVYGNDVVTLWNHCDEPVSDTDEREKLLRKIKNYITVTDGV